MPLILGTNSIKDTGYDVANSLRFNHSAGDEHLEKVFGSGNRKTWTWSGWIKRADLSAVELFGRSTANDDAGYSAIRINGNGDLIFGLYNSNFRVTDRRLRDVSAWYHIVVAFDTTQGTAANRVKIYVNGVQESSFSASNDPDQNTDYAINENNVKHQIGGLSSYFGGYMCEVAFLDGTATAATTFGEFDSDSPTIWKPKNFKDDVTFGTNGFYMEFAGVSTGQNSSGFGADTSGNGLHFASSGLAAEARSIDTCTNNFCTINVLDNEDTDITITQGNLNYTVSGGTDETNRCTFGFTKGKWYFESKFLDGTAYVDIGVGSASDQDIATPRFHMEMAGYYMIQLRVAGSVGTRPFDNGSAGSSLGDSSANDINMFAIDMDNNKFYAGRNGTWYSSGDPAGNSNPLITMDDGYTTLMPSVCAKSDSAVSINFGSPSYTISSGNTDGNGFGNFEYAVPSGFFALCTKNLAEHG